MKKTPVDRSETLSPGSRFGMARFPSLARRGRREAPGWSVERCAATLQMPAKRSFINRYCSSLNRPPQPSLRDGIPALLAPLIWTLRLLLANRRFDVKLVQRLSVDGNRFEVCNFSFDVHADEIFDTGNLLSDAGRRNPDIVKRRSTTTRRHIVDAVFQVVLIVVVVAKETSRNVISLKHRRQRRHV